MSEDKKTTKPSKADNSVEKRLEELEAKQVVGFRYIEKSDSFAITLHNGDEYVAQGKK